MVPIVAKLILISEISTTATQNASDCCRPRNLACFAEYGAEKLENVEQEEVASGDRTKLKTGDQKKFAIGKTMRHTKPTIEVRMPTIHAILSAPVTCVACE